MPLESKLSKLNIRERLDVLEEIYKKNTDVSALSEAHTYVLENLLKKDRQQKYMFLSHSNRLRSTDLLYKLHVKYALIEYFHKGYLRKQGEALFAYLQKKLPKTVEHGLLKTQALFEKLIDFVKKLLQAMTEICLYLDQVQDAEGNVCVSETTDLKKVITEIETIETSILAVPFDTETEFGKDVIIFNLKDKVKSDVNVELNRLKKAIENVQKAEEEKFLKSIATPFESVYKGGYCEYFPVLPLRKETRANCLFLCSPFYHEVLLYVASFAQDHQRDFVVIEPKQFNGKSESAIRNIFRLLVAQGKDCLITDINEYRNSENKDVLLREMIAFGKQGRSIFIVDRVGTRKAYNKAFEIAKAEEGMSIMDVSYTYLTMPAYSDTIALFEEKGMITVADYTEVKQTMAFMGFCGLNDAINMFTKGKNWKETAAKWSRENESIAFDYLANLPLQVNLIDNGWGDYPDRTVVKSEEKKREFDYDDLAGINSANVRKIVDGPYNLFAKCGCIVAYCLLAGSDISIWKTLNTEQQSERLTMATRLVMRLLDVDIEPEVKVVPIEEWTLKGAGGVCCDGGKRIEYKQDCIIDYDWIVGAVVHECFHAFQHKATREWKSWYFDELGVTKGRVNEWAYNNGYDTQAKRNRYYSIDKNKLAYMVQIVESDARAFEIDCNLARAAVFAKIQFE